MTDSGHDGNNAVDEERGDAGPADGGKAEKRSPRSIRFLDPEWESIEAYAETRGLAEGLDMQYLCLSALDFVMERSAIEAGATTAEIVEHIANEATRVKPSLTNEQTRKICQVVLDHTSATPGTITSHSEPSTSTPTAAGCRSTISAFSPSQPADEGPPRFKLAAGAQTLMLAMLDVAPKFAEEAEAIMIRKAIERGRFDDARTLAQRA